MTTPKKYPSRARPYRRGEPAAPAAKSRLPLGDYVARATAAVGIKPCGDCKRRQAVLNEVGDHLAEISANLVRKLRGG